MGTLPGHLFVVHGDLTTLSCDGVLVPCDATGSVSEWWREMFDVLPSASRWAPLPKAAELKECPTGPRRFELVDTVSAGDDVDVMLAGVRAGLEALASRIGQPRAGRVVPLVAMPVPGTGRGNFQHRRGAVVKGLVPLLQDTAAALGVDVALVMNDRRDYAAVQAVRASTRDLTDAEKAEADRLGDLAGRGELSVFVGAGASIPLGLPGWGALVSALMTEAGLGALPGDADEATLKAGAELAHRVLGDRRMGEILVRELGVIHHALSHALLADLRLRQSVTTNFDTALELAMAPVHGEDLRVMTRQWARSCSPWLLKLHGSIDAPEGIVLTSSQYQRHETHGRPLYGLVQGLLMTSHLLFVGFSLSDSAYLKLAEEVDEIHRGAAGPEDKVATALGLDSLAEEGKALDAAFHHVGFREGREIDEAARTLEIFLDRVAWRATRRAGAAHEYLLDDRYLDLVDDDATSLRGSLHDLATAAASATCEVAGSVREVLQEFGADPAPPPTSPGSAPA